MSSQQQQHHEQQDTTAEDEATTTTPPPELPRPTKSEVHSCQFSTWYPTFRNISKSSIHHNTTTYKFRKHVTIESQIIRPLPHEFIQYLLSDGVRLPQCARNVSSCMKDDTTTGTGDNDDDDDDGWENNNNDNDDDDDDSSNEEEEEIKQYNFPQLTEQIQTTLQTLGGGGNGSERCNYLGCMPKLNWSSPKDATWMNCGTLKCTTVGDVYLLLKSSEFVCFDLEKAWYDLEPEEEETASSEIASSETAASSAVVGDDQVAANTNGNDDDNDDDEGKPPINFEYELVLRKWCNLHPSMEFRCFVYDHELIAISQRHSSKFYSHLQLSEEEEEDEIHPTNDIIHSFYETYVQHRFASGEIHKYVMDVYVDSQERTWIVDFNVWGKRTDSLLFEWGELMEIGERVRKLKKKNGSNSSNEDDDEKNGEGEVAAMLPMPEWRVVTKDMKDLTYDPLSSFRGPTDVMNLMGGGGGGNSNNDDGGGGFEASSFKQFMDQCVRPSEM